MIALITGAPASVAQDASQGSTSSTQDPQKLAEEALKKMLDGAYAPEQYRVLETDDDEQRLMKQQINCLYAECDSLKQRVENGSLPVEQLLNARHRLGTARLEFHTSHEEKRQILKEQLDNARELEDSLARRFSAGLATPDAAARAASFRISVELAVVRLDKESAE